MIYDRLLDKAYNSGLIVKEKPLLAHDGLIFDNRIAIRKDLETRCEKGCILAEELGHFYTGHGNILPMISDSDRRQERRARGWAYDSVIGLDGLLKIKDCQTLEQSAETLDVSVEFLYEAIDYYTSKYAPFIKHKGYIIQFIPHFEIRTA